MEIKKLNFIIKNFGCYTTLDGQKMLTSLGNAGHASVDDFWNVFSGDAEIFFDLIPTEDKKVLSLVLDERIRKYIEREYITKSDIIFK